MINRLKEVTSGLYRGSCPEPKDVIWLHEKLNINKIVSLDEDSGESIDKICRRLNIKQVKIYLDMSKDSLVKLFSYNFKELLLDGGPTFVHCLHGKDRTGLLIALFECKYLGKNPEDAIKEAEDLGFGIGVNPKIIDLYKRLINVAKPEGDSNSADIVSNERSYKSDNRDSFLQEADRSSFAPYQSGTKQAPFDFVYNPLDEQSNTRQNYKQKIKYKDNGDSIPMVGVYDNAAGINGAGPSINAGGFIYD